MVRVSIILCIPVLVFGLLLFTGTGSDIAGKKVRTAPKKAETKEHSDISVRARPAEKAAERSVPEHKEDDAPVTNRSEPRAVYTEKVAPLPEKRKTPKKPVHLYNKACKAFENERYGDALVLFQALRMKYGKTDFYTLHSETVADYTARSGLYAENPSVSLYFYENFEYESGRWKARYETSNCFRGSEGALKGVPFSLGEGRGRNSIVTLVSGELKTLFALEKGRKLNFCYHINVWAPVHVQIWDSKNRCDYYYDIRDVTPGVWQAVSLPLSRFKRVGPSEQTAGDIEGECGYLSFSTGADTEAAEIIIDEVSVTGSSIPSFIEEMIGDRKSPLFAGPGSDLGSDGYLFNMSIIAHWKRKRNPEARKGTFLMIGDVMTEWVHIPSPLGSGRRILDSRVKGKRKRSHEIAACIEDVLKEEKPEVAVIMTGLFDVMYPKEGITVSSSVERIVKTCCSFGTIPVLFGLPRVWDREKDRHIDSLNGILLKYARMYRIPFVDTKGLFAGKNEKIYYSAPAVLSGEGKKKLAQVMSILYNKIQVYIIEKG